MFLEYPKAIYLPGESDPVVVHTAEHEAALLVPNEPEPEAAPSVSDKNALLAEAADLGIEVDRRWGVQRLRDAIAAAR